MANNLDQIVEKLRKALDASLVSVVLYGSGATGDHNEKFSDYNVLSVLTKITPAELRAVEPVFPLVARAWQSLAAAADRTRTRNLHRLLRHRIPGYPRAPSHPLWPRPGHRSRNRSLVLPRSGRMRTAHQSSSASVRKQAAFCPITTHCSAPGRFRIHFLHSVPPRSFARRRRRPRPQA